MKMFNVKGLLFASSLFIAANIASMESVGDRLKREYAHTFVGKKEVTNARESSEVTMWNQEEMHLEPKDTKTKELYTNGLAGCTAYAFLVKCKNKALHAQMSHYPPTDRITQMTELSKANEKFEDLCGHEVAYKQLLIMTQEDWVQNNGKWEQTISPQDKAYAGILGCRARVTPRILPYSGMIEFEQSMDDFTVSLNHKGSFYTSKSDDHKRHTIFETDKK